MLFTLRRRLASVLDRLAEPGGSLRALGIFLTSHLLVWTTYACVTRTNLDTYGDMVENFAWGQEWQLGYHKHPPLFAWISAAWFEVFPSADWAYFLLSQLNVVLAFTIVWLLARRFLSERRALMAVILLELVPFYGFLSIKFNAYSVLLAIWPLTALFFHRAYVTRRLVPSLLFGVGAAMALLSMYYSLCLLAALFLISLLGEERRDYYSSASPWVSVLVTAVILAPHLRWLFRVDLGPVQHATGHVTGDALFLARTTAEFVVAQLLYVLLLLLAFVAVVGRRDLRLPHRLGLLEGDRSTIFGLMALPFLLTVGVGTALRIELSTVWAFPMWFFLGAGLLVLFEVEPEASQVRRCLAIVFGFQLAVLAASPLVALGMHLTEPAVWTSPRKEVAAYVSEAWHREVGEPLRIVAGTKPYADSVTFYSSDHPSLFIDFDFRASPWISPARLRTQGIAVVCLQTDRACIEATAESFGERGARKTVRIASSRTILPEPEPVEFFVALIPPESPPRHDSPSSRVARRHSYPRQSREGSSQAIRRFRATLPMPSARRMLPSGVPGRERSHAP